MSTKEDTRKIFEGMYDDIRQVEKNVMHLKTLFDLFRQYRSEATQQNFIDSLKITSRSLKITSALLQMIVIDAEDVDLLQVPVKKIGEKE